MRVRGSAYRIWTACSISVKHLFPNIIRRYRSLIVHLCTDGHLVYVVQLVIYIANSFLWWLELIWVKERRMERFPHHLLGFRAI